MEKRLSIKIPNAPQEIAWCEGPPRKSSCPKKNVSFGSVDIMLFTSPHLKMCELCFFSPQVCRKKVYERGCASV